ncbi:MAG: CotH kinase family protein [Bacteroidales bacterium]|nr:CotH kinase family protein [Bacteroidales bacterium]MCF8390904.1 CotH kinase family protein [Bacteroidales bacterium]
MRVHFYPVFLLLVTLNFTEIFAQEGVNHWETAVYASDHWSYKAGAADIPVDWIQTDFDASGWATGSGGLGYDDNDDATIISPTVSVFLRIDFDISDPAKIDMAILHADYDDAFIAYLNGVEIARSNIGIPGELTPYNETAISNHEAKMYECQNPDEFQIPYSQLNPILKTGKNTLAIQVHNRDLASSDLSAIFFLSFGITDETQFFRPVPEWFTEPFSSSDLPLLMLQTNGQYIQDDIRIVAHLGIIQNEDGFRNNISDSYNNYNGNVAIEIRGSSSQSFPKKNYSFETQDEFGENNNVSILGLPVENDWVLHGPYSDKSLMRNVLAYHIGNSTGRYTPRTRWCELIINNQYEGIYVLTEKIKRDVNRVDIATLKPEDIEGDELTGGYIFQIDRDNPNIDDGFYSAIRPSVFYEFQDPDYNELLPVQKQYLKDYIYEFERIVKYPEFNLQFLDYIDVPSFADYWIATEIFKHIDAFKLSFYMYKRKDSNGGKIHFGPIWDMNLGFGNFDFGTLTPDPDGWSYIRAESSSIRPFWIIDFLETDLISNEIACRWKELREGPLATDSLLQFIEENRDIIEEAQMRNFERWPVLGSYIWPNNYIGPTYNAEMQYLKTWLIERLYWMDTNMVGICYPDGMGNNFDNGLFTKVFPNPFRDEFNVELITNNFVTARMFVYNSVGNLILETDINSEQTNQVSLQGMPAGFYFYKLTSGQKLIGSGKLIKNQ